MRPANTFSDSGLHNPTELAFGLFVFELADTYSGMMALKAELDRVYGEQCDFRRRMAILSGWRSPEPIQNDVFCIGAYLDWLNHYRPDVKKYVAFSGSVPYAFKFDDTAEFTLFSRKEHVMLPGGDMFRGRILTDYIGGTAGLSFGPETRLEAAHAVFRAGKPIMRNEPYANKIFGILSGDRDPEIRAAVALNPCISDRMISRLVKDPDWRVRLAAIENSWQTGDANRLLVSNLVNDPNDDIRMFMQALRLDFLGPSQSAVKDPNPAVRAIHAFGCNQHMVRDVLEDDCEAVQMYLMSNRSVGPDELVDIADRTEFDSVRTAAVMKLASWNGGCDGRRQ